MSKNDSTSTARQMAAQYLARQIQLRSQRLRRERETNPSILPSPPHKRQRRLASEIERHFRCNWPGCNKAYGALGSLVQHKQLKHGCRHQTSSSTASDQLATTNSVPLMTAENSSLKEQVLDLQGELNKRKRENNLLAKTLQSCNDQICGFKKALSTSRVASTGSMAEDEISELRVKNKLYRTYIKNLSQELGEARSIIKKYEQGTMSVVGKLAAKSYECEQLRQEAAAYSRKYERLVNEMGGHTQKRRCDIVDLTDSE